MIKKLRLMIVLSVLSLVVFPYSISAETGNAENVSSSITTGSFIEYPEDEYSYKTTITSIETDGEKTPGYINFEVELLKTTEHLTGFQVKIASKNYMPRFGTGTNIGLFDLTNYPAEVTSGIAANFTDSSDNRVKTAAQNITFKSISAGIEPGKTGVLFTCKIPVNPNYDSSWKSGFLENITVECSYMKDNGTANLVFGTSDITIPPAGVESSSEGNDSLSIEKNFTAPTATYFTDAGITVTPSDTDLSFTVASQDDKACVVAIDKGDGTYTRLTGTALDGAYKFEAQSVEDKIVVAVKGDVSGDGAIDSDDYGPLVAKYLETGTLNSLQSLIGDINADGVIDSDDYGPLVAAYLETGTISW